MNLEEIVNKQIRNNISETNYKIGKKYRGKVRDVYDLGENFLIITTDRMSAFDRGQGSGNYSI